MKTQNEIEEQNLALAKEWIEQWDKENFTIADKLVANDFVLHVPGFGDIKGAEGYVEAGKPFRDGFPGFRHIIEDGFAKGDKVNSCGEKLTHWAQEFSVEPGGKNCFEPSKGVIYLKSSKYTLTFTLFSVGFSTLIVPLCVCPGSVAK